MHKRPPVDGNQVALEERNGQHIPPEKENRDVDRRHGQDPGRQGEPDHGRSLDRRCGGGVLGRIAARRPTVRHVLVPRLVFVVVPRCVGIGCPLQRIDGMRRRVDQGRALREGIETTHPSSPMLRNIHRARRGPTRPDSPASGTASSPPSSAGSPPSVPYGDLPPPSPLAASPLDVPLLAAQPGGWALGAGIELDFGLPGPLEPERVRVGGLDLELVPLSVPLSRRPPTNALPPGPEERSGETLLSLLKIKEAKLKQMRAKLEAERSRVAREAADLRKIAGIPAPSYTDPFASDRLGSTIGTYPRELLSPGVNSQVLPQPSGRKRRATAATAPIPPINEGSEDEDGLVEDDGGGLWATYQSFQGANQLAGADWVNDSAGFGGAGVLYDHDFGGQLDGDQLEAVLRQAEEQFADVVMPVGENAFNAVGYDHSSTLDGTPDFVS